MKKLINYALDLNNLRKTFGYQTLWKSMKSELRLQVMDNPINLIKTSENHAKILVLSPHPDDDVFGLGGTLSKFQRGGDSITIVYFCDGSKGTPEGIRDSSLIIKRKKEVKDALKVMNIDNYIFWGYKDGQLQVTRTSIKALNNLIDKIRPDIIFIPSLMDDHPDHKATNEIFYYSYFKYPEKPFDFSTLIAMYEVWTPLLPNRIVNISDVINIKKEAISYHKSQLRSRAYDKAILALNQYRAELNGVKGFAEAFYTCDPAIYKELYDKIK